MRRILKWVHPSGVEIPPHPGEYAPQIEGLVAFKADGTPADVCAGFVAARKRLQSESE